MFVNESNVQLFASKDDSDYPDSYQHYRAEASLYGRDAPLPVVEMKVPLCCDSCEKKVRAALHDCAGVKDVMCDRDRNRVTVTGFVDPLKALRRVKKVKPKSDLHGDNTYIKRASVPQIAPAATHYVTSPLIRTQYAHHYVASPVTALPLVSQASSYDRRMQRMPSFGRVERYDDRRGHHPLVPVEAQRDYYGIRRMPSFKRHRHHDAEFVSMGDDFSPAIAETRYVSLYHQRPADVYRKQVSFSKLPVMNPYYMKGIEHEDNY